MSTKTTIYRNSVDDPERNKHLLKIEISKDLHESTDVAVVTMWCSTCYCLYNFLMNKHLGEQLAEALRESNKLKEIL